MSLFLNFQVLSVYNALTKVCPVHIFSVSTSVVVPEMNRVFSECNLLENSKNQDKSAFLFCEKQNLLFVT